VVFGCAPEESAFAIEIAVEESRFDQIGYLPVVYDLHIRYSW
jgi:hypothetical protein